MSLESVTTRAGADTTFHHEALFYEGVDGFLAGTVLFIRDGVEAGEATLVLVSPIKIALLREALGDAADAVEFADMDSVGANPARIIPAWREFARRCEPDARVRGIGEPIHPDRRSAEMVECHRHESLLNVAFADIPGFTLLCPYDVTALDPADLAQAIRTHPYVSNWGTAAESPEYGGLDAICAPFGHPLPDPPRDATPQAFSAGTLGAVRGAVLWHGQSAGLRSERAEDFVLAVNEVAANSVRHGGGRGTLRMWRDDGSVVCEIRDAGRILDPLAGRERPGLEQENGHGLWLANQLCDLVQVRTFVTGSTVRLHMRIG